MTTVTDGSYRSRILGLLGDNDPVQSLEASAARVEALARQLGEKGLARSYGPGKWTGTQILCHLADAEIGVGFRLRQALAEDNHRIQTFDESAWAKRYAGADAETALRSFRGLRAWNLALIRSLAPAERSREAVHPDRGPETVDVIVRMLAGHDLNHIGQLETIARA